MSRFFAILPLHPLGRVPFVPSGSDRIGSDEPRVFALIVAAESPKKPADACIIAYGLMLFFQYNDGKRRQCQLQGVRSVVIGNLLCQPAASVAQVSPSIEF
jgi:hypothetical protein